MRPTPPGDAAEVDIKFIQIIAIATVITSVTWIFILSSERSLRMNLSRREMMGATGALIVGAAGAGHALGAPQDIDIEVHAEREFIVLRNTGGEDVDLSGYTVDFEHQEPDTQLYELDDGTVVGANDELVVRTGAEASGDAAPPPNTGVSAGFDAPMLNNEDPDVIALIDPDGTVVASTTINTPSPTATATRTPTEEPTETPTPEPEDTPTPTEEPEDTPTPTEEPTETPTPGDGGTGGGGTASVTFDDQNSDGSSVVVRSATLSDGGFLVIHDQSGAVLGHSAYLEAGSHSNVGVTLDDPITATQVLIAMAHTDDGDQSYEFPGADGPYTAGGAPVTDDARVTIC